MSQNGYARTTAAFLGSSARVAKSGAELRQRVARQLRSKCADPASGSLARIADFGWLRLEGDCAAGSVSDYLRGSCYPDPTDVSESGHSLFLRRGSLPHRRICGPGCDGIHANMLYSNTIK